MSSPLKLFLYFIFSLNINLDYSFTLAEIFLLFLVTLFVLSLN